MASAAGNFASVIQRYSIQDIAVADEEIPWVPYAGFEGAYFKPLRFDVRNNVVVDIGWLDRPAVLGRHQHHGEVLGYCLEGSFYYKEYDWVARPGTFIHEAPGAIHTQASDDPNGFKALFVVSGNIDFFGDNDTYAGTQSVWWWIDAYERHCEENGLKVNEKLFF